VAESEAGETRRIIAQQVQKARRGAGYESAEAFADALGQNVSTWRKKEGGYTSITVQELKRINELCGNIDFDFYFDPNMSHDEAEKPREPSSEYQTLRESIDEVREITQQYMTRQPGVDPKLLEKAKVLEGSPMMTALLGRLSQLNELELARMSDVITGAMAMLRKSEDNGNSSVG